LRHAKVNKWTSNLEKVQHLGLALDEPALQVLREISEDAEDAYEQTWSALA